MEVLSQTPDLVRKPHFPGVSYSADPSELAAVIDRLIAESVRVLSTKGEIGAIISPTTSGSLYGEGQLGAVRSLVRKKYSTVVVLASAQQSFFDHIAVFQGGAYDTPLGRVFVDLPLAEKMANTVPKVAFSRYGHAGGREAEYAIEMMLPYLQKLLGDFRFVPLVLGNEDEESIVSVGEVVSATVDRDNTLVVGCSELIFEGTEEEDKIKPLSDAITRMEWRTLYDRLRNAGVAGSGSLAAIMYAAKRLAIKRAEPLVTATSQGQALSVVMMR